MAGAGWLEWLEHSSVALATRDSLWLYPAIETAHIVGFVILVGSAVMFDLRLLGFSRTLPVDETARHLLRWSRSSLLVVIPTGFLLFAVEATATWANPAFRVKLLLIALAGLNAFAFHRWTFKGVAGWNQGSVSPPAARLAGVASIALWTGVITCGRLIAYL